MSHIYMTYCRLDGAKFLRRRLRGVITVIYRITRCPENLLFFLFAYLLSFLTLGNRLGYNGLVVGRGAERKQLPRKN